jgi:dipeptidyl-peptidase-4
MSFPRQQARTQRFTIGVPRSFEISPDGRRVAFLRGRDGVDTATCLWVHEAEEDTEHVVADPRDPLLDVEVVDAAHAVVQRHLAESCRGEHATIVVDDHGGPIDQLRQVPRDLGQPVTAQHQLEEGAVDPLGAGERLGLPVQDPGQHLVQDLVEPDVVGQLHDREPELVGHGEHLGRDLVEVAAELDADAGQPGLVELPDQLREGLGAAAQRVGGRQQELAWLDPRQDVGDLHHVQPLDLAVQPAGAGQHLDAREDRCRQHLGQWLRERDGGRLGLGRWLPHGGPPGEVGR